MASKYKLFLNSIYLLELLIIFNSCSTLLGAHYSIENIAGNATLNQSDLSSDYGDIKINYYANNNNIRISNKSDSLVVIDLANSYFIDNGRSLKIYNNSEHTTGSAQSFGVYINNTSTSKTTFESTSTKEQRFISIPPHTYSIIQGYTFPFFQGRREIQNKEILKVEDLSPTYTYIFSYQCGKSPAKQTHDIFYVSHLFKDQGGTIKLLSRHPDWEGNKPNIIRPDMQYYGREAGGLILARFFIATCTLGLSELIINPIDSASGKKRTALFYDIIDRFNRNGNDTDTSIVGNSDRSITTATDLGEYNSPETIKQKYFDIQDQIKANKKTMKSIEKQSAEYIALKQQNTMLRKEMQKLEMEYFKLAGTGIMMYEQTY